MTDPAEVLEALRRAYADYARSAEGAGSVQARVVQRLVEAVFDAVAMTDYIVVPTPYPRRSLPSPTLPATDTEAPR